jgi:hypothetical protein
VIELAHGAVGKQRKIKAAMTTDHVSAAASEKR